MPYTIAQIIASNTAGLKVLTDLTAHTKTGLEKLLEGNLAATQAIFGQSLTHLKTTLAVQNTKDVLAQQTEFLQPVKEQSAAYVRHFQLLADDSAAKFKRQLASKVTEVQKEFVTLVDTVATESAVRSESAANVFKTVVEANQSTLAEVQKATQSVIGLKATADVN
jgi:phasin family protein